MAAAPAPRIPEIADILASHRPRVTADHRAPDWQASTALILLDDGRGPEILFIQRVERAGDRWSGHMALPGGKREPLDRSLAETAAREAREETGVRLDAPLGRLDDQGGRAHRGIVATYVFALDGRPDLRLARDEVADAVWIPVGALRDPDHAARHPVPGIGPFPAVRYEGYVIWGLTLRILDEFLVTIGAPLP